MPDSLIVANLDCEEEWAALRGPATARSLTTAARSAAASASVVLRALAGPDALLWTLEAVDPARLNEVPGLPSPRLASGPPERAGAVGRDGVPILAWGETPAVHALRGGVPAALPEGLPPSATALWRAPPPEPETAARVNDRRFALEAVSDLVALPGTAAVESVEALAEHLERGGAEVADGAWVVKAPLSAAGRDRVIGRRPADLERLEVRRRLENLFGRRGPLVVEPWVERTADFACSGLVGRDGVEILGLHRLEVGREGRFTGVELPVDGSAPRGLAAGERRVLERTALRTGDALAEAGYSGPFGLDAFRWRDRSGASHFHPLAEINARMTFGLVARVLVDRVRRPLDLAPDARVALRFGRDVPVRRAGTVPLVRPAGPGEGAAPGSWLEIDPPESGGRGDRGRDRPDELDPPLRRA